MKEHRYYVYIVANASRLLYTGVTSPLEQRIWQHKNKSFKGFTSKWQVCRLVYFERFQTVQFAIAREKQIKGYRREKKIALIEKQNPDWKDLSDGWYEEKSKALSLVAG